MSTFIKGFNHGYILAKDLPKLYEQYKSIGSSPTEYGLGFGEGAKLGQKIRMDNQRDKRNGNRNRGDEGMER